MPDAAALWAYFGIFAALVAAGLGAPIPEEIPVVTAGVMLGHASQDPNSHLRWWIMLPICIAGVVISDGLLYGIGRLWGPRLLKWRWLQQRLLPQDRLERIENNFHKSGVKILLMARLLPAIRSPIFITAGIMRLPLAKFLLADSIYAVPGVSLLFFLGFWFTDQFLELVNQADHLRRPIIVLVVITVIATYLILHFFKRPVATGEAEDLPPIISQVTERMSEMVSKHDPNATITFDPSATLDGRTDRDTMVAEKPLEEEHKPE